MADRDQSLSLDELCAAQVAYEAAEVEYEKARERRNTFIRQALDEGWTHARIGGATGLTRGRIGQIAQRG